MIGMYDMMGMYDWHLILTLLFSSLPVYTPISEMKCFDYSTLHDSTLPYLRILRLSY